MAENDKILCVQVFGLIEVEPSLHAFGFAHTPNRMPPEISQVGLDEALRCLGAVKINPLPIEGESG